MRLLDKIILPNPRNEKVIISLDIDVFRKRLYNLIDLRFSQLDNKKMLKKFSPKNKNYFGTIGEDFFIAQTKSTIGMNEYYHAIITEGEFRETKKDIEISFKFELPEKAKGEVRFFTFFSILAIGITFYKIVKYNFELGWFYILMPMIAIVLVQVIANFALKSASNTFLRKFNEVMN